MGRKHDAGFGEGDQGGGNGFGVGRARDLAAQAVNVRGGGADKGVAGGEEGLETGGGG